MDPNTYGGPNLVNDDGTEVNMRLYGPGRIGMLVFRHAQVPNGVRTIPYSWQEASENLDTDKRKEWAREQNNQAEFVGIIKRFTSNLEADWSMGRPCLVLISGLSSVLLPPNESVLGQYRVGRYGDDIYQLHEGVYEVLTCRLVGHTDQAPSVQLSTRYDEFADEERKVIGELLRDVKPDRFYVQLLAF